MNLFPVSVIFHLDPTSQAKHQIRQYCFSHLMNVTGAAMLMKLESKTKLTLNSAVGLGPFISYQVSRRLTVIIS